MLTFRSKVGVLSPKGWNSVVFKRHVVTHFYSVIRFLIYTAFMTFSNDYGCLFYDYQNYVILSSGSCIASIDFIRYVFLADNV